MGRETTHSGVGRLVSSAAERLTFAFEDFTLDPHRRLLLRRGQSVPLRPVVFDVLLHLVSHPDRLVTKEELFAEVWKGRIVGEANLTQAMFLLRRALDEPTLIVTLPGHGYRFTAPVTRLCPPPTAGATHDSAPPPDPAPVAVAGALAAIGAPPLSLVLPLLGQVAEMTALFGRRYEGFYRSTRPYSGRDGFYMHDHLLVRMGPDGLLRLRIATAGVIADGWVLPFQNHLFVICTEFTGGHLLFAIMHAVHSVEVKVLDGITLNNSFDIMRTPTATRVVHHRIADLSGDVSADDARLLALAEETPIEAEDQIPEAIRAHLTPDVGPGAAAAGGDWLLRLPVVGSLSSGRELAGP